jgi:hypothetical protein
MAMSEATINASVRSLDGKQEITFARTTDWNAPVIITLGAETIEVLSLPLSQAVSLVNLEGNPT